MNIIEKYDKSFLYTGVFFNLIIAWRFFMLWYYPEPNQVSQISTMAMLMAFEFIMVHSGVFMAVFPKKWSFIIFFPFYGIFALAFAASMNDWFIIPVAYLIAVFNRMRFAFADVPASIKARNVLYSVIAVLIYFILVFVVAFGVKYVPDGGLTHSFLSENYYFESLSTGGLFLDVPKTAICLGFLYYTAMAIVELLLSNYKKAGAIYIPFSRKTD